MRSYVEVAEKARGIFVGIDVHRQRWQVTIQTAAVVLVRASIGGSWEELKKLLSRWSPQQIVAVYEAGFSGFWLYDELVTWGADCMVVPPSRIPVESGNRVKTDRIDSAKLAALAASGQAVRIWVPSLQQRQDREVTRGRRRIVRQLRQVQCQIKALLHCYGLVIPCRAGRWSAAFEANLWRLRFSSEAMQRSFEQQLEHYQFLRRQLAEQTKLVRQLAASERYQAPVKQLTTIPGIGVITAMEILTELGDIARFARAGQLAAYVGLTPSQYSSGEHVRMGHISRCGKAALRGMLVESSWIAIRYDQQLAAVYERLKVRCGGKRAIVAVARRLLLRVRRIWLEGRPYQLAA